MTGAVKLIMLYLFVLSLAISLVHFSAVAWDRYIDHRSPSFTPSPAPKITSISRDFVYDLSGSEASGLGDAMKLFDENCDPKKDPSSSPRTNPLPTAGPDKFFPKGKGLRIVIDLQGIYALSELYWYDKALESDSAWLYTGDMLHWQQEAAYCTSGTVAGWGWKAFPLKGRSRYVMIRFNSAKSILAEMVLYGFLQKTPPAGDKGGNRQLVNRQRLPSPTLREFAGTNVYDFVPTGAAGTFS